MSTIQMEECDTLEVLALKYEIIYWGDKVITFDNLIGRKCEVEETENGFNFISFKNGA